MPEGDTIFRAARTLHRALAGRTVVRFESAYPALTRVDEDRPLRGRTVESVTARGKHLLMAFSGELVLHTHMRMHGSWHVYRPGEPWRRPARDMRILVGTADVLAVGFNIPVAELLPARDVARHPQLGTLGPDLAGESFDGAQVIRRLRESRAPIADALLDQRIVAGVGNVLKSEILFVAGVHPFAPAAALPDDALNRIVDASRRLMLMNVGTRGAPVVVRRTTGSLDPSRNLWVYGRGGRPCLKCGRAIRSKKSGLDARSTYWCPACQPEAAGAA